MAQFYLGNDLIFDADVKLEKVELTQQEYDDLADKKDNVLYIITDAESEDAGAQIQFKTEEEFNEIIKNSNTLYIVD